MLLVLCALIGQSGAWRRRMAAGLVLPYGDTQAMNLHPGEPAPRGTCIPGKSPGPSRPVSHA